MRKCGNWEHVEEVSDRKRERERRGRNERKKDKVGRNNVST